MEGEGLADCPAEGVGLVVVWPLSLEEQAVNVRARIKAKVKAVIFFMFVPPVAFCFPMT